MRDLSKIDPNAVPSTDDKRGMAWLKHPASLRGGVKYDRLTLALDSDHSNKGMTNSNPIQVFKGKWTGDPNRTEIVPEKFLRVRQPNVGTCSKPGDGNLGCHAWNGCPYPDREDPMGRGPGPFNVMIERDGQTTSCPCYAAYVGIHRGRPTSQAKHLYDGWRITTDICTEAGTRGVRSADEWGNVGLREVEIENPVTELGPMYAHHFGQKPVEAKPPTDLSEPVDLPTPTLDFRNVHHSQVRTAEVKEVRT